MDTPRLSVRACVRYGWETFKKRPWFLVGATAIVAILNILIPNADSKYGWMLAILVGVVSFLLTTFLELGINNFSLEAHDDVMAAHLTDLWRPDLYPRFLAATFLALLISFVGFVLLIIPGIIVSLMLCFTTYLVIDRDLGPIEALKESRRLTKGNRWKLFLLFVTLILLNILGALLLLVGLLVTLPVSGLAAAHAYRTLAGESGDPSEPVDAEATGVAV